MKIILNDKEKDALKKLYSNFKDKDIKDTIEIDEAIVTDFIYSFDDIMKSLIELDNKLQLEDTCIKDVKSAFVNTMYDKSNCLTSAILNKLFGESLLSKIRFKTAINEQKEKVQDKFYILYHKIIKLTEQLN